MTADEVTRRVAKRWADENGWDYPSDEAVNADFWCRFIARAFCEELGVTADTVEVVKAVPVSGMVDANESRHMHRQLKIAAAALAPLLHLAGEK